jgi:hypothetical protein
MQAMTAIVSSWGCHYRRLKKNKKLENPALAQLLED